MRIIIQSSCMHFTCINGWRYRYVCERCRAPFDTKQALGGHRASHSGQRGCSWLDKQELAEAAAAAESEIRRRRRRQNRRSRMQNARIDRSMQQLASWLGFGWWRCACACSCLLFSLFYVFSCVSSLVDFACGSSLAGCGDLSTVISSIDRSLK